MISAQGTPKVPAGKFLFSTPGITTELAGTRPFVILGPEAPVTSMIFVEEVSVTPAPSTTPGSK